MKDFKEGEMVIRKAGLDDSEILSEVGKVTFTEAFGDTNTKEDLQNYLNRSFHVHTLRTQLEGRSIFYIAELNGDAVGYLKLNLEADVPEVEDINAVQLERIYIRKYLYGAGLGTTLLERAVKVAGELNFDHIWLGVWQENKRAIDFYLKHNFKTIGTKLFRIGENITKDFVMLLQISHHQ